MREHKTADLISRFDPVFDGRTEVNSRINARFAVLGGGLGKSCKRTGQARKWRAACRRKRNIVCIRYENFGQVANALRFPAFSGFNPDDFLKPNHVNTDNKDFGPAVGLAWSPAF